MKQFDVHWVNLDPTVGREIKKTRPCIIVSPNSMNTRIDTVLIVPLTSTIIDWPFRTAVNISGKRTSAACDQLRSVSKLRIGQKVGCLSDDEQQAVAQILQEIFAN